MDDKNELFPTLEELGLPAVRERLARRAWNAMRDALVKLWKENMLCFRNPYRTHELTAKQRAILGSSGRSTT